MLSARSVRSRSVFVPRAAVAWPLVTLLAFVLLVAGLVVTNEDYREAFDFIIGGLPGTLLLTGLSFAVALLVGMGVAWGLRGRGGLRRSIAASYVELVDSIPPLVVIFLLGFGVVPLARELSVEFDTFEWLRQGAIVVALGLVHSVTAGRRLQPGFRRRSGSAGRWAPSLAYVLLVVLKDTSLAMVMGRQEITGLSNRFSVTTFLSSQAFLIAAGMYAALALLISAVSRFAEAQLEGQAERKEERRSRRAAAGPAAVPPSAHASGQQDVSRSQSTRYLAASIVLDRGLRQTIREMVEDPNLSFAPELGIDFNRLVRVSALMDARERSYDNWLAMITVGAVAGGLLIDSYWVLIAAVGVILAMVVQLSKNSERTYQLLPLLHKERFDLGELETALAGRYGPVRLRRSLPDKEQNLVVYSGFIPFVGAGTPLGGWSFPINVSRPLEEVSGEAEILPFTIAELYEAVEAKLDECEFSNMVVEDYLFANGIQIRDESWILPTPGTNPVYKVDKRVVRRYLEEQESVARHYKWIQLLDWGNEIVVSYFLRFVKQGDHAFVEVSRFVLTPAAGQYRRIDRILPPKRLTPVGLFLGSLVVSPLAAARGVLRLAGRMAAALADWDPFGAKRRGHERRVREDVYFDYGARTTLRQIVSSLAYDHYFQMLDKERYVKVLEKQVIEAIVEFLEAHGIDPSDIKDRRTTILNSGLIVQGGEVRAEALSVGTGARATADNPAATSGRG